MAPALRRPQPPGTRRFEAGGFASQIMGSGRSARSEDPFRRGRNGHRDRVVSARSPPSSNPTRSPRRAARRCAPRATSVRGEPYANRCPQGWSAAFPAATPLVAVPSGADPGQLMGHSFEPLDRLSTGCASHAHRYSGMDALPPASRRFPPYERYLPSAGSAGRVSDIALSAPPEVHQEQPRRLQRTPSYMSMAQRAWPARSAGGWQALRP